jgi:flagellar capping protein FliD
MEEIEGLTVGQLKFKILELEKQVDEQKNSNQSLKKQFEKKQDLYWKSLTNLQRIVEDLEEDCRYTN